MALSKRFMALVALVLVLLAVAIVLIQRGPSTAEPKPGLAASVAPLLAPQSAPAANMPRAAEGVPPPWATGATPSLAQADKPLNGQPMAAGPATASQRELKELEKLQQELTESMREGKQPDPKKVAEMLNRLKEKHGSTVVGVNLDAVISNLQTAQDMQALALEIQHESGKPGGGDSKKMQGYIAQLTKLQSRMRMDISVPQKPEASK